MGKAVEIQHGGFNAPTAVNVTVGDAAPRQYLTEMLARPRINEMQIA
jgi:hypothetical protein